MNIGIIDADLLGGVTTHPNLALMKISAWCKENNHDVTLLTGYDSAGNFDKIYLSKVFSKTEIPVEVTNMPNLTYGGTGFDYLKSQRLDDRIEHHFPDYTLYHDYFKGKEKEAKYDNYFHYSIGFTTRGCFRKCSFCVNKDSDRVSPHSPPAEFVNPRLKYIEMLDDNFLGYSGWRGILEKLQEYNKPIQFKQGLDIRLITEEKARILSNVKYKGDMYFAFDHIKDKNVIIRNLRIWNEFVDYKKRNTKFYVLCGFESQGLDDVINTFERIRLLQENHGIPYIMRHQNYLLSPYRDIYIQLARWTNQTSQFKKRTFREFCELRPTSSGKALKHFEEKHPDIAFLYFDKRFG